MNTQRPWLLGLGRGPAGRILGDPGADSGDEGKSKRAEKCGTKKSKERREELRLLYIMLLFPH